MQSFFRILQRNFLIRIMDTNFIEQIFGIYDEAKNRILLYVQASVSPEQFKALRKLILDELGLSGAEGKVKKLIDEKERAGKS